MQLTPSQWAWSVCDCGDFPPPIPARGDRYGPDAVCYLCGGSTGAVGWPVRMGIADTFTDVSNARAPGSRTVCQPCVATSRSEGWVQYVAAYPERGLSATFPEKNGKPPRKMNWLYFSHLFTHGGHECPDRARWRAILADPPDPPFLAVFADSGKKQLIFKSRISLSKTRVWLQMDDDSVLIIPDEFRAALADFMALYLLGFSKDSILSGRYSPKTLFDVGAARWRPLERMAAERRNRAPELWRVCHAVAQRPADWEAPPRVQRSALIPES